MRSYCRFLVLLFLSSKILSCSEPEVVGTYDFPEKKESIGDSLLIVNSLSEDFSLINNLSTKPQVYKHIPLYSSQNNKKTCKSANEIVRSGDEFFVTCSLSSLVSSFDLHLQHQSSFLTGEGSNPLRTSFSEEKVGYVSLYLKNQVHRLDSKSKTSELFFEAVGLNLNGDSDVESLPRPQATLAMKGKIYASIAPTDKQYNPAGHGYVVILDASSGKVLSSVSTSKGNTGLIIKGNLPETEHLLYVLNGDSFARAEGTIDVLDTTADHIIHTINLGGIPSSLTFDEKGIGYVGNSKEAVLKRFDSRTYDVLSSLDLRSHKCQRYDNINFSFISSVLAVKNSVYVTEFNSNCLIQVDQESWRVIHEYAVGDGPIGMVFR